MQFQFELHTPLPLIAFITFKETKLGDIAINQNQSFAFNSSMFKTKLYFKIFTFGCGTNLSLKSFAIPR